MDWKFCFTGPTLSLLSHLPHSPTHLWCSSHVGLFLARMYQTSSHFRAFTHIVCLLYSSFLPCPSLSSYLLLDFQVLLSLGSIPWSPRIGSAPCFSLLWCLTFVSFSMDNHYEIIICAIVYLVFISLLSPSIPPVRLFCSRAYGASTGGAEERSWLTSSVWVIFTSWLFSAFSVVDGLWGHWYGT